jgi:lipopolysaccharide export system protein LptA
MDKYLPLSIVTIMFFLPIYSIALRVLPKAIGKGHLRSYCQKNFLDTIVLRAVRSAIVMAIISTIALFPFSLNAQTQNKNGQSLQNLGIKAKRVEANSTSGVVTFVGNVQINYPSRKIQGTAAQAQYYSRERRLVLSGNVYVLQEGNSMQAETMTYLIDEGRFIATPKSDQQVESIYLVPENPDRANSDLAPQLPQFEQNSQNNK